MAHLLPVPAVAPASPELDLAAVAARLLSVDGMGSEKMRFTVATSQGYRAPVATVWRVAAETELLMGMHEGVSSSVDLADVIAAAPRGLCRAMGGDRFRRILPAAAQPKVCLVIGGAGAASSLHADPFDWTGWSFLIAGTKEWTFYGDSSVSVISAVTAQTEATTTGEVPPRPCCWERSSVSGGARFGPRGLGAAFVATGGMPKAFDVANELPPLVLTQRAGDFIVFPGGRFHQVVHTQGPTLALCGQACDPLVGGPGRALSHAAAWRGLGRILSAVEAYSGWTRHSSLPVGAIQVIGQRGWEKAALLRDAETSEVLWIVLLALAEHQKHAC